MIVIDPTDVRKNYAKKMPYLATVRDGSNGELASGYWDCVAVACDSKSRHVLPLHQRLWSAEAPDFESENAHILQVIDTIREPTQGRGIYVMDRGGGCIKLLNPLLDRNLRFIVRCVGDRDLHFGNTVKSARELGKNCPVQFVDTVIKEGLETQKSLTLRYGFRPVKLPGRPEQLYLVVVHGFGEEPMLLLANVALQDSRKSVWAIVTGSLCRWLIEETVRFIKQSYRLEDIRVLKYERLQNMMALVLAAAYFAAVWLGESLKLAVMTTRIKQAAKHFFTVPDFHYYALADGIATLLSRLNHWKSPPPSKSDPKINTQMAWSFADP